MLLPIQRGHSLLPCDAWVKLLTDQDKRFEDDGWMDYEYLRQLLYAVPLSFSLGV